MSNRNTVFIKPAEGLLITNPATNQRLPTKGDEVELTSFWRRRLRDGDAVKARRPSKKTAEEK